MAQDYVLRMIQQIAAMLAGIVAKRQQGDLAGAEAELQDKCLQHVGLPLMVVKHSSPEVVSAWLASAGAMRHLRAVTLAELLLQDAALSEARGNPPEAVLAYEHAFRLLHDALGVLSIDDEKACRERLSTIAAKLRDLASDTAVLRAP